MPTMSIQRDQKLKGNMRIFCVMKRSTCQRVLGIDSRRDLGYLSVRFELFLNVDLVKHADFVDR